MDCIQTSVFFFVQSVHLVSFQYWNRMGVQYRHLRMFPYWQVLLFDLGVSLFFIVPRSCMFQMAGKSCCFFRAQYRFDFTCVCCIGWWARVVHTQNTPTSRILFVSRAHSQDCSPVLWRLPAIKPRYMQLACNSFAIHWQLNASK